MSRLQKYILNPVSSFPDKYQLVAGLMIWLLGMVICHVFDVLQDGVFHSAFLKGQTVLFICVSNVLVLVIPTLFVFVIGTVFNRQTRLVDVWNTVLFSRFPLLVYNIIFYVVVDPQLLTGLTNGNFSIEKISTSGLLSLFIMGLGGLLFFAYSIIILINGFKTAINAKKIAPYLGLLFAIIVSEITYRLLFFPFLLHHLN